MAASAAHDSAYAARVVASVSPPNRSSATHTVTFEDGRAFDEGLRHFLVYLSGIGAMDPHSIPQEEIDWGRLAMRRILGASYQVSVASRATMVSGSGSSSVPAPTRCAASLARSEVATPGSTTARCTPIG